MLTFRTDLENFLEGTRQGTRIVTGAGIKTDFNEFSPDASTLGLWHLHHGGCEGEGTGLEDASGGGHTLVNHGAAAAEDGYRLVQSECDYLLATIGSMPAQTQVTLEGWVRDWQTPGAVSDGRTLVYSKDSSNRLMIYACRATTPANSYITILYKAAGVSLSVAWQGAAADAILAGSAPWHVAAVLSAPDSLRLFVNGVLRAEATGNIGTLQAGVYTLSIGYAADWGATSAIVDEVRLSSTPRYAATFTPQRLLASGTYAGPAFDGVRLQADWAGLVPVQSVPTGTAVTWEVRAADETDAFGEPQAVWEPYNGNPATLPDGRYFQWRATLSTTGDRLTSPTLESVEAQASEAGYDLFHATGPGPEALDYSQAWARVGPTVAELAAAEALEAPAVHWFGIRPVDDRGIQSPTAQAEVRLELDAAGGRVPDRPAGVLSLAARPAPLGAARLDWRYRVGAAGVVPQTFRIFGDGGSGTIDYDTPIGEAPCHVSQSTYTWTSNPLTGGTEHQLAVRAVTAGGLWDEQPAVARVTPDASPPGEVTALEAEVLL